MNKNLLEGAITLKCGGGCNRQRSCFTGPLGTYRETIVVVVLMFNQKGELIQSYDVAYNFFNHESLQHFDYNKGFKWLRF